MKTTMRNRWPLILAAGAALALATAASAQLRPGQNPLQKEPPNLIPNADLLDPANPLKGWCVDYFYQGWYVNNKKYVRVVSDHAPKPGVKVIEIDQPPLVASNQGTKVETLPVPCESGASYRASIDTMTYDGVAFAKLYAIIYAINPEPNLKMKTISQRPAMDGLPALKEFQRIQFPNPASGKTWVTVTRDFTVMEKAAIRLIGAQPFRADDLKDPAALVTKLLDASNPVSQYLMEQFSNATKRQMRESAGKPPSDALQTALVEELNKVIQCGQCIYTNARFAYVKLSIKTYRQLQNKRDGKEPGEIFRLNRYLLEDAYRDELAPATEEGTQRAAYVTLKAEAFGTALKVSRNIKSYFCNFKLHKVQ